MKPVSAIKFVPPPWWSELVSRDRCVVYVTQGTYSPESMDVEALILLTIRALEQEEYFVIATSPLFAGQAFSTGDLPVNVRIPHSHLLPLVDILITNAG